MGLAGLWGKSSTFFEDYESDLVFIRLKELDQNFLHRPIGWIRSAGALATRSRVPRGRSPHHHPPLLPRLCDGHAVVDRGITVGRDGPGMLFGVAVEVTQTGRFAAVVPVDQAMVRS